MQVHSHNRNTQSGFRINKGIFDSNQKTIISSHDDLKVTNEKDDDETQSDLKMNTRKRSKRKRKNRVIYLSNQELKTMFSKKPHQSVYLREMPEKKMISELEKRHRA